MNNESLLTTFNALLAFFTFMLVLLACTQYRLLRRQFYAEYRPEMLIRHVKPLTNLIDDHGNLRRTPFNIEMEIMNRGATAAIIVRSNVRIGVNRTRRPLLANLEIINSDAISGRLEPGEQMPALLDIDPNRRALSILATWPTDMSLYLIVDFTYRDKLRRSYKTSTCRRFTQAARFAGIDQARDRFVVVNDPDYEYAD